MQEFSYSVMLSLKEISLRKVTVILWSKTDILDSFDKPGFEDKIKDNMSKLELPPLLTEQLNYLVRPVGLEIRTWRRFLKQYLTIPHGSFEMRILKHLCWTHLGTLDYQKMAEKLIRHEMFDCVKIFKLACLFCLEDYIPVLWESLPEINKRAFYHENRHLHERYSHPPLQFCWPYIIKGKETKLDIMASSVFGYQATFNQYAFEYVASKGNKAATKYFFQRLSEAERASSLFRTVQVALRHRLEDYQYFHEETFPEEKLSETIFYLLSLLSCEQQLEIFKKYPCHVFMCLLDWPWQELFWDMAGLVWPFLLEFDDDRLITTVAERITSVNYFPKLFQELFLHSSSDLKKRFVERECQAGFFRGFFKVQNSDTIKVIFRNVDSVERKKLVSCEHVCKIFYELISREKLYFVELCLQEARLSKEDKEGLKEAYFGFFKNIMIENNNSRKKIWEQFLHILD